jgi:epoxyqueuosine reductase
VSAVDLATRVRSLARILGFDLAGIGDPAPGREGDWLRDWLAQGYAGDMDYIGRRVDERVDPARVLPGVRSIVAVALRHDRGGETASPVARYARGEDYHDLMRDRLLALAAGIEALAERPVASRAYVDTGPVQERTAAARAGLGWVGKNACLIHPRLGSYLLLGVLLTDLELASDASLDDHCGSCRACLDACPTQAFVAPRVLDARRCIAYTTIESGAPIPAELREAHGEHVFGCDVCQEVCPWNRPGRDADVADPLGLRARLAATSEWERADLEWILALDEASFLRATRRSALRRSGYRRLLRNALVAAGNSGLRRLRPLVERHLAGADALLAEHARWALERLS